MPGAGELARARLGTRPGDPLADIVYGFVAAKVRLVIHGRLLAAGLEAHVPWDGRRVVGTPRRPGPFLRLVPDVLYADDDAFPVIADASA